MARTSLDTGEHAKREAFLEAYGKTGNVKLASKLSQVSRTAHYEWLQADPVYADAFAKAKDDAADMLVAEARKRATIGVRRYKFTKSGEPIMWTNPATKQQEHYSEQVYSDVLLLFLIKGARPEVYRDRFDIRQHSDQPNVVVNLGPDRDVIAAPADPYGASVTVKKNGTSRITPTDNPDAGS